MNRVGIVVLAAGEASRMGSCKQLLPWLNSTLIEHAVHTAISATSSEVMVVLGANRDKIEPVIGHLPITILYNEIWRNGMGSSIALAAEYAASHQWDALVFMLADQPGVTSEYIQHLVRCYQEEKFELIASQYHSSEGVPALFSATYFEALNRLNGKLGARRIIQQCKSRKVLHPKEQLWDLDTPEAYEEALKKVPLK